MTTMNWTHGFSPALLDVILKIGEVQDFGDRDCMIQFGDCDTHLFHILSGEVSVDTDPVPTTLKTGDLLGEMAFLDNRPRTATASAVGPVKARRIERQELFRALCEQPLDIAVILEALTALQQSRLEVGEKGREMEPRAFVEELAASALSHRALRHPYLSDLASGNLPDMSWALTDFARHYHGYSSHFPRYLTALISRLEKTEHRGALLENLTEESGQYDDEHLALLTEIGIEAEWVVGVPHPLLFQRFREALGMNKGSAGDEHIEVVCWRDMFLNALSCGSPAEAVGALGLGTENIVRQIYVPFVRAIESAGDISARDAVFFPLHAAVDDHHQAALASIAIDLAVTPEGRFDLARGMHKALSLRADFWSWLHERALNPEAYADD
jgi:CRP-like cAMP-binding protein